MFRVILLTAVFTSFLTLVVLNLGLGERQIHYQLTHRFPVSDPQFLRCMGQLLRPGILPGNRITALHNGDQVFPAMLASIRGARESITFETYIHEYQSTMYHRKVLIVHEVWVSVGSTNVDDRSLRLNNEADLNIYDAAFASEQVKVFAQDKDKPRLMTHAQFVDRSPAEKLFDAMAGMVHGQL